MLRPLFDKLNRFPLAQKILAPVFLVLILLGLIATIGAVHQTQSVLSKNIDQSLNEQQAIIEQAIKEEERLLIIETSLLTALYKNDSTQANPLTTLGLEGTHSQILDEQAVSELENEQLQQLFAHARKSGKPRIRFFCISG